MGRYVFFLFTLGLFGACGGESVYTEGGTGGDGASGGSKGGGGGKGGEGGKGGTGGDTGGTGGVTGGTGGDTGGVGGDTGGVGGRTGGAGGAGGRTGGAAGIGGNTGGIGGTTGGAGGAGGKGGGPAGAGGVVVCPSGYENCGNICVDLETDRRHCGECDSPCLPGQLCDNGACTLPCASGLTDCFGICVNTNTDPRFCGDCEKSCGVGEICAVGDCILPCPAPLVQCGNVCTSVDTDPQNCGACGNVCPPLPEADTACEGGECVYDCNRGMEDCNGVAIDGCEADLMDDDENCGACGVSCDGDLGCVDGTCPMGTYHWRQVSSTACNAWCSQAPAPFNSCGGPWACGPGTLGGLIWIYAGGPNPPPNPASTSTKGYGWVHWYCDQNGCDGPGPQSGSCDTAFDNAIYQCVFE